MSDEEPGEMNAMVPPQVEQTVSKDCLDVANLLEGLAKEARAGKICAVGMVVVNGPGKFSTPTTANMLMEQFIGCSMLMDHLKAFMVGVHPAQVAQREKMPKILRPGGPTSPLPPGFKFP